MQNILTYFCNSRTSRKEKGEREMEMGRKRTRQKAKSKGAKGLALLMAGLLALGLLAGCGEAAGPAADEPAEPVSYTHLPAKQRGGQSTGQ